jgi:acetyl-CoA carboxylase biotin carboxyl carrier protein
VQAAGLLGQPGLVIYTYQVDDGERKDTHDMPKISAHMAGMLLNVVVNVGDTVAVGQEVATLESMKMQIAVQADVGGTVKAIKATVGEFVDEGAVILELE